MEVGRGRADGMNRGPARANQRAIRSRVETSRTYRGITPSARQADRRERLMEAGLELFGTLGYARTSVRAVSAAASLNSRYFYESYRSREDLLYAVYQRIVTDIFTRAAEATARETNLE